MKMNNRSLNVFFYALLISVVIQNSTSYVFQDENQLEEKNEGRSVLYPFRRSISNTIGEISKRYGVPFPRSGEEFLKNEKRQGLITLPRIGRELQLEEELFFGLLPNVHNLILETQEQINNEKHPEESRHVFLPISIGNRDKTYLTKIDFLDTANSANNMTEANEAGNVGGKGIDTRMEDLIPLVRHGQDDYFALVGELRPTGGIMPYPRLGRHIYDNAETLIPYPRTGRSKVEPLLGIYDLAVPEYVLAEPDGPLNALHFESLPFEESKRRVALIPRVGRKKRSISQEQPGIQDIGKITDDGGIDVPVGSNHNIWEALKELDEDTFLREDRQNARSRSGFVPRVGKKKFDSSFGYEIKRKMLFTPRIGRASLIPRIGRNDPRFQVKNRGAFIPRIGRSAGAIVPRIGRSEKSQKKDTD
ncbi:uncharacterized protein LOC129234641 [Uloborus diversus]|uniref:uncharacterized protein LOC129234641 n=1 Tax=Uloborus diversus TaxID=327109 RepID=UPI0024098B58|nr:uncharacterized protein LOC129234641 [Uloborus diversus]